MNFGWKSGFYLLTANHNNPLFWFYMHHNDSQTHFEVILRSVEPQNTKIRIWNSLDVGFGCLRCFLSSFILVQRLFCRSGNECLSLHVMCCFLQIFPGSEECKPNRLQVDNNLLLYLINAVLSFSSFVSSDLLLFLSSFPISTFTSLSLASISCFPFISISLSSAPGGKLRSLALQQIEREMAERELVYLWVLSVCLVHHITGYFSEAYTVYISVWRGWQGCRQKRMCQNSITAESVCTAV